jgi:hypothetical protein
MNECTTTQLFVKGFNVNCTSCFGGYCHCHFTVVIHWLQMVCSFKLDDGSLWIVYHFVITPYSFYGPIRCMIALTKKQIIMTSVLSYGRHPSLGNCQVMDWTQYFSFNVQECQKQSTTSRHCPAFVSGDWGKLKSFKMASSHQDRTF